MRTTCFKLWIALLATGWLSLPAEAATWISTPDGSSLEFTVLYEGTEAPGQFEQFHVDLDFSPEQTATASIRVEVSTASARLGSEDLDEAVKAPEWLDIDSHPLAVFTSNHIVSHDDADYIADGLVTIKGVSKSIQVPLHWREYSPNAEISGELTLSRLDFGIGSGEWAEDETIGFDVRVRFRVKLQPKP